MKLIIAIVNNDDSAVVSSALTKDNFTVTKLSTTGGFLMVGNTTLLIGSEDEDVDRVKKIIKNNCETRVHKAQSTASFGKGLQADSLQHDVSVGGATLFVLDVTETVKY